ncbi:MAG: AMP-binding protein [Alphaproteobacteria bacterium]|nr:AMP-binding protein [Alphaproteobacteria bacterium]
MTKTKERPPLSLDDLAERYAALGAEIAAAPEKLISLGAALAREAARHGDKPAVIFNDETLSWRALHERSNRIARALIAKGLKQGDYLTIALPNSIGFVEACYGAWKVGAVPQPVSSRLPQSELKAIADLADGPVVVGAPYDIGRPSVSIDDLLALSDDASDLPEVVSPSWKAPTSGGSTGRPKLIVSGASAVATGAGAMLWQIEPDDIVLMPGPLYHNGPFSTTFAALEIGAPVIIMPKFDAEQTLKLIEKYKVTWIYTVPTMMGRMWRLPDRERYDVSSLRVLWHLAAPCPPWLKEAFIDWLGPDVVMELYGGTEGVSLTMITGREWMTHKGSVGRVFGRSTMRAFSADGRELPMGEVGEIYMKLPEGAPPSYKYLGAETRALEGGWESIGDIGYFDAEGFLYLADRRTDMILVGGANVYPAEVEAAIDEHPLVASSCVIGIPDDDLGNKVHAIVQPRGALSEKDLLDHIAGRLVIYKRPRTFEFVNEPLRDDAGKVRRSQLRAERVGVK